MLNIAQLPRVGVGVLIVRNNKILLSKRLKEYGYGQLALPGGHVEWEETLIDCAKREVLEETGLQLKRVVNTQMYTEEISEGKHYVTFYLIAKCPKNQEPQQTEPTKHEPWNWYDPWKLPNHTWAPTKRLMKRIKKFASFNEVQTTEDAVLSNDGQSRVYVSNSGRIASVSDRTDLRNDPEAFLSRPQTVQLDAPRVAKIDYHLDYPFPVNEFFKYQDSNETKT